MIPEIYRHDTNTITKDSVFLICIGLSVCFSVLLLWNYPDYLTFILVSAIFIQVYYHRTMQDIVMMVSAALIGTPSEILCVKTGIWTYYGPDLVYGIPYWIPLIWGFLFCFFRRFTLTLFTLFDMIPHVNTKTISLVFYISLRILISTYLIYTFIHISRHIAYVYTLFFIILVLWRHSRFDVIIFLAGGFFGTLGEYLCMKQGYWIYHTPFFKSIGLPISLPIAWGLSAVLTGKIARLPFFRRK